MFFALMVLVLLTQEISNKLVIYWQKIPNVVILLVTDYDTVFRSESKT